MSLVRPCLRCGGELNRQRTGRTRDYCSDACRQAGCRLRKLRGPDWWHAQPWYPGWQAEWEEWRAARKRERDEAVEERTLLESMPPGVRAGAEAARRASFERNMNALSLATVRLQVEALNAENEDALRAAGLSVELVPAGHGKVAKLLHTAVLTDSEAEAAAMLARARALVASGEGEAVQAAGLSPAEVLRRFSPSTYSGSSRAARTDPPCPRPRS